MRTLLVACAVMAVIAGLLGPVSAQPKEPEKDRRTAKVKPTHVLTESKGWVTALYFSADSSELLSVGGSGRYKECLKWDVATGKLKESVRPLQKEDDMISQCAPSLDYGTLARITERTKGVVSGKDTFPNFYYVLEVSQKKDSASFEILIGGPSAGHLDYALAVSPDGKTVAIGEGLSGVGTFTVWDLSTKKLLLKENDVLVETAQYAPDGKYLILSTWGTVAVLRTTTLKPVYSKKFGSTDYARLAVDAKSKTLAVADETKTIRLVGLADGKERLELEPHTDRLLCVAFSPDGKYVAAGSEDHTLVVWDAASGKKVAVVDAHVERVLCIAFSPDGKTLATGSQDRRLKLWSVEKVLGK